jgi:hypothetical protein
MFSSLGSDILKPLQVPGAHLARLASSHGVVPDGGVVLNR